MTKNQAQNLVNDEPDYLLDRITNDIENTPGFLQAWEPRALVLELAKARKERGLSQQAVADAMHIDRARIAELERDPTRVSFGRIVAYANMVGVHLVPTPTQNVGLVRVQGPRKGRPIKAA